VYSSFTVQRNTINYKGRAKEKIDEIGFVDTSEGPIAVIYRKQQTYGAGQNYHGYGWELANPMATSRVSIDLLVKSKGAYLSKVLKKMVQWSLENSGHYGNYNLICLLKLDEKVFKEDTGEKLVTDEDCGYIPAAVNSSYRTYVDRKRYKGQWSKFQFPGPVSDGGCW